MTRDEAFSEIRTERGYQIYNYGFKKQDPFQVLAALIEEVGELSEAIQETYGSMKRHPSRGGDGRIKKEAVQVAAMAVKILEEVVVS